MVRPGAAMPWIGADLSQLQHESGQCHVPLPDGHRAKRLRVLLGSVAQQPHVRSWRVTQTLWPLLLPKETQTNAEAHQRQEAKLRNGCRSLVN